jgi:hypothetical protein
MACDHSGTHSGATRYLRQTGQLRLVLVCDRCGAERSELGNRSYSPAPRGSGTQAGVPRAHEDGLSAADGYGGFQGVA